MCLEYSLCSKNCFFPYSRLFACICFELPITRTPDNSNLFRFPLKVRVIGSRLYMYSSTDSVTEMRSGNLVHGSCIVSHGSGNGGNAKWPDKICECVRVNCLNCKMETRTIECVAFFYHEGAKRDDFIQKNKFRCCVDSSQWGSVVKLGEHVW